VRILIVGGSGYLGGELVRQAVNESHETIATYLTRHREWPGVQWSRVDIRRQAEVAAVTAAVRPTAIINAAYRRDDWASTANGAAHVALAAASVGARLVHVSSDAVFSGVAARYDESALPDPIIPYGAAKAAAETAIRAIDPTAAIVRTSLITGDGHSAHEAFVRDLIEGRRDGVMFADVIRCPVHVTDLASALLELTAVRQGGVRHVAGADAISRYELGCLIARSEGLDPALLRSGLGVEEGTSGPVDVRLDCARSQGHLRTRLRGAREFLAT
jgi:dTDP-4-dehydrorhamnose reductase